MTIKDNLPNIQIPPKNPIGQLHSNDPCLSVLMHVPPFTHGFGEQASKYMTNYHKSSFYRMQMLQILFCKHHHIHVAWMHI